MLERLNDIPDLPHFLGIVATAVLATLNERLRHSTSAFLFVFWHLTGVFLHELCHLLAGVLLMARPVGFSVFPRREETPDGRCLWQLGSVTFQKLNAVNSLPVALAPLGLVWLAFWIFSRWDSWFSVGIFPTIGMYVLVFVLLYNAMPSRQDLRVAAHPVGLALYAVIAIIAGGLLRL